jgi:tetratricopeptide (TPR) repeat protein
VIEQATPAELQALLSGAATLSRSGNRTAAIAALLTAVELAPADRTAHRRLAAAYAVGGDTASARAEYDRFIARLEVAGSLDAAIAERSYASALFPPRPLAIARPAGRLTADQAFALRRVAVVILAIAATVAAMFAAGAQIFASGGPL